ncbi:MAG: 3-deoxy-D-manno-octulosonic acid transferase [Rhodospirillales bacterium]|nr:3-deoxy-D-manno-octulosonic acid transferase [Rhodospirillales bacterium]
MKLALYRMATFLGGPLIRLYLNRRIRQGKEDPARLNERLGLASLPRPPGKLVWIHGASVGEALSILPLIERIQRDRADWSILITTGTVTSAKLIAERLPQGVMHQYVPVDRVAYVRRFLEHWKPNLALWMESEFWPNLVVETRASAVPMVVLNGRMSERSFAEWQKNRAMIWQLIRAFRLILAQSDLDAERFSALGAKAVDMPGNIKYACAPLPVAADALAQVQAWVKDRPRWLAASTHAGEETIAARAHLTLRGDIPGLLTIIVPRHPHRGETVAAELTAMDLKLARRSIGQPINTDTDVYIADTLGEMGLFYRLAQITFIGKTLVSGGGQNPIEPAQLGCALIFGPDMSNFQAVAKTLLDAGAAVQIADEAALTAEIARLLRDHNALDKMVHAAKTQAQAQAGVMDRVMAALTPYFEGVPNARA